MASKDDSLAAFASVSGIDFAAMNNRAGRQSVAIGRSNAGSLSVPLQFGRGQFNEAEKAEKKKREQEEMDDLFGLPETWARHSQQRTKQDNCFVCEKQFSVVAVFGVGDRDFFCKQCGHAVCSACSSNKKFLSKDGKEKFRVCDLCDTKLDNIRLRLNFDKFCALKDDKIGLSEQLLASLKE